VTIAVLLVLLQRTYKARACFRNSLFVCRRFKKSICEHTVTVTISLCIQTLRSTQPSTPKLLDWVPACLAVVKAGHVQCQDNYHWCSKISHLPR